MAKLLVIGGTGFFGKSILDAFNRGLLNDWDIDKLILMARNTEDFKKEKFDLSFTEVIDGDISTINYLPQAEYIIHAAASTDAKKYLQSGQLEKKNIILGVNNFCKLAEKFEKKSKILYVSSGAVYGTQPSSIKKIPEEYYFNDSNFISPNKTDYTEAKRCSEELIKNLSNVGLSTSIARCFAFVGSHLPLDKHFAIGNFIYDGLHNRPIKINSTHQVYRSYMYSDDLVVWLMTILNSSNRNCPIYNVGSDEEISIADLGSKVASLFGQSVQSVNLQNDVIDRYIPSIEKAKNNLGLNINFNLDIALKNTISKLIL